MYIRIQQQQIRYRISRHEAEQLLKDVKLSESVQLSSSVELNYSIKATTTSSQFEYIADENRLALSINKDELIDEIQHRPSKKGMIIPGTQTETDNLTVYLEVDIKKH